MAEAEMLRRISPKSTLEELIPQVLDNDSPLSVVDENGSVIGVLDQRTILLAMGQE